MSDPDSHRPAQTSVDEPTASLTAGKDSAKNEVTLLDLLLIIARGRRVLLLTIGGFLLIGVLYSGFASVEYTSTAQVVRESTDSENVPGSLTGGLSALQGVGLGSISFGGDSGLSIDAYPSVLESREVRLAVVRDSFFFPEVERRMTYVDYVTRPPGPVGTVLDYTLFLPATLQDKYGEESDSTQSGEYPTDDEEKTIEIIADKIESSIGSESGLMTVSVTSGSPRLSAAITESLLAHFEQRVQTIQTQKAKENLAFARDRFVEAQDSLRSAEERLENFLSRNVDINSPKLRFQRDRLQRQVNFESQVYQDLQKQLTQLRMELQKSEPVITIVEQPVPPLRKSAPDRLVAISLSLVLGIFFGLGAVIVRVSFSDQARNEGNEEKLREIKEKLLPSLLRS